jgi:hypothetical protein
VRVSGQANWAAKRGWEAPPLVGRLGRWAEFASLGPDENELYEFNFPEKLFDTF